MYSRRKGKAGSKKPLVEKKYEWVKYKPKEIEQLIVKVAKNEPISSKIGIILRDSYGVPDVQKITGKSISKILENNKINKKIPDDLANLIRKQLIVIKHLEKNKKDQPSKRGLILTESKIRRLIKYYKRSKVLPKEWVYSKEQAKLLVG